MSGSAYSDLERPPLREAALRRALLVPGGFWTDLRVVAETGSSNADVGEAARNGTPEGLVIVAERQTAGRGRMGRHWESPARAGLTVSVLLRPAGHAVPVDRYGWLPLLAGVALVEAVTRLTELAPKLKWPNDLMLDGRKCAGILAETQPAPGAPPAVVVGIGLNVTMRPDELPIPEATSLLLAGAKATDRDPLLREVLRRFEQHYLAWCAAGGDAEASGLRAAYRADCATIGRKVRVTVPGGGELSGQAVDVDTEGRLVVLGADGVAPVAAGDVKHVR